ncbi:MAG TPA: hypothetical protein PKD54_04110 [Pirellulaceae bacterium]|mgnify:CR=1 FL=1|nr:hypothetical protein [Pirellulaceae bacterium]
MATGIERNRELRRRRKRRTKMAILKRKLAHANSTEKDNIARKIRKLTPGAEQVLTDLNLSSRG